MSTPNHDVDDPKLSALLRDAHPAPDLPPRFHEGVWRRLDRAERSTAEASPLGWLGQVVRSVLRPAYATAGLAVLMLAGAWLGVRDGEDRTYRADRARYVAAVSPFHRAIP